MKIQVSKYLFSLIFALLILSISCSQIEEEAIIITEDVLFLSGERVRLSGRIYSNGGGEVSDHGFEIGNNDSFDNPILIQNGTRSTLGAFIGESSQLISDKNYFYRAYAVIEDVIFYGESKSFLTLNSSLTSFSPHFAYSNDKLKIIGANFSSNTKVFFGDSEAEILSIDLESIIEVKVPEIATSTQVIIKISEGGSDILFDTPFEYIFGIWDQIDEFPQDFGFFDGISLIKGDHYVFGLGVNHNAKKFNSTIWDFDLNSNSWQEIPYTGDVVRGPISNNGGYFGGGALVWGFEPEPIFGNEFWQYKNGNLTLIGEVPFDLYRAASFYFEGEVFVVGGLNIIGKENYSMYLYSEATCAWNELQNAPIVIAQDLPNFRFKNFQYFITEEAEVWSFDLTIKDWNKVADAPIFVKKGGIAEVIDDKAYIGIYSNNPNIWEYDIANNSWKVKSRLSSTASYLNSGSFVKNSTIRVIRVNPNGFEEDRMPIFEFDPVAF